MINMPHNNQPILAIISTSISIFSASIALITLKDLQIAVGFIASLIAIISGCFAIRYYYYSTKKIKDNIIYKKRKL